MSLMIKGINLPKHCKAVEVKVYISGIDGYKEYNQEVSAIFTGEALDNIIQIPKEHGRLIDAKLLKDTIKDSIPTYTGRELKILPTYGDLDLMDKIDMMPTILEAEG